VVAFGVDGWEHAEAAGFVVVFAHPRDREEVRELPDEHDGEEHQPDRFSKQSKAFAGCDGGRADHGWQGAGDGTDERVGNGDWFERCVDEYIGCGGNQRDKCGDLATGDPENDRADDCKGEPEEEYESRAEPFGWDWSNFGAIHQRVTIRLVPHIEGIGPA